MFGTFLLVSVDAGGAMIAAMSGGEVTPAARSAATGLLIMTLVYATGDVSGAHFNPAVTLAFALRRSFPWRKVPGYWASQVVGAVLAAVVLRSWFGNVEHVGASVAHFGPWSAFGMEVLLTTILVSAILGTAVRHKVVGPNAALASGGAVALCSLFSRPVSGASMNPARSLGPAVASGYLQDLWVYRRGTGGGRFAGHRGHGDRAREASPLRTRRGRGRTQMNLEKLRLRDSDGDLQAVVETPRGSTTKLKYEPELETFVFSRPLVLGVAYPYDWGFFPSTVAADGDPLDVMVMHDATTHPGVVIPCQPIGVVRVSQKAKKRGRERNDRVIAVPSYEPRFEDIADVGKRVQKELQAFFQSAVLLENKGVRSRAGAARKRARALIAAAERAFLKQGKR